MEVQKKKIESVAGLDKAVDNSFVKQLHEDPETEAKWPNSNARPVFGSHYVRVAPQPLTNPFLVTHSPLFVGSELRLGSDSVASKPFWELFSGDLSHLPSSHAWATPYALSIFSQPIMAPDPRTAGNGYGDGRALSFCELLVPVSKDSLERSVGGLCPSIFKKKETGETGGKKRLAGLGGTSVGFEGTPQFAGLPSEVLSVLSEEGCAAFAQGARPPAGGASAETADGAEQGEGGAVTLGEGGQAETPLFRRWELQWKGAGPTPFCRGADGRAVLRSSIREFLASEFLAACGVPTTRAVCTIGTSKERAIRPWYESDSGEERMGQEPCAITTRAAPSFLRIGHFELWARRVAGALPKSDPEDAKQKLTMLVKHAILREYPNIAARHGISEGYSVQGKDEQAAANGMSVGPLSDDAIVEFLEAVACRMGDMIGGWMNTGYVQSNFNSDNCLVGGRTMDFGPFGFVDQYSPSWIMWVGGGDKFSFMQQPLAAVANYVTLVRCLVPLLSSQTVEEKVQPLPQRLINDFGETVQGVWRRKMGFVPRGAGDGVADGVWDRKGEGLAEDLLEALHNAKGDWTIFWRRLADLAEALDSSPLSTADLSSGTEDPAVRSALLTPLQDAWYEPLRPIVQRKLVDVLCRWAVCLREAAGDAAGMGRAAAGRMRLVSPRYVPREHLMRAAYEEAQQGKFEKLQRLQKVLLRPFADGSAAEQSEFDRKTPEDLREKAGINFMSCSS